MSLVHWPLCTLACAGVDIFASSGVTDGRGAFGYVVYVREDQFEKASSAAAR
jgi:hypothetical protein